MAEPSTGSEQGPQAFIGYLAQARAAAWNPSAEWLARHSGIPKSTIESLISGRRKRLPDWTDQVEPLLLAYRDRVKSERGQPDAVLGSMAAWKRAYDDAHHHRPLTCPLPAAPPAIAPPAAPSGPGRPIGQVRPLDLEVHPAIDAGAAAMGLEALPVYLPRAHDEALAAIVAEARDGVSRIVVLVGESSTGKTRALWEAVRKLEKPWRLWHPIAPYHPQAVLASLGQVGSHTVIWLNETQHYLLTGDNTGEQVAAGLRELLRTPERGPVLVVGTLWLKYAETVSKVPVPGEPDPHAQARELLKGATLRVPDTFTGPELDAAARLAGAGTDPRWAEAVQHAPGGALTQYMAGGLALIERYRQAAGAARAVLHAAMDARRLGHGLALPRLLLEQAAAGYLSDEQWDLLDDDWLEQAFAYLTDHLPCRGARPPLSRIRSRPGTRDTRPEPDKGEPSYRLTDFLEQHGAHTRWPFCPPALFWDAATRHAATPTDHAALARAADRRGRYHHAFNLWQRAANAGNTDALRELARLREKAGDQTEAERLYRAATDAGNTWALRELARLREKAGDRTEAERLALAAASAGNTDVLGDLALLREEAGDRTEAERLALAAADAGETWALRELAHLREKAGDRTEAERLYRAAADAGNTEALRELALLREEAGDRTEAERLVLAAASAGNTDVLGDLALLREKAGDRTEAERLALAAADAGETWALRKLAHLREEAGDRTEAERLYRAAADAGNTWVLGELARLQEEAGDRTEAERLALAAADAGDTWALRKLAHLRKKAGDRTEAERLYRAAADAGNTEALRELALLREKAGDRTEAERLALAAADAGDTWALRELAHLREETGDRTEAERLALAAADAGNTWALRDLARMREEAGDRQEAERLALAAADAGDTWALRELASRWLAGDVAGRWGDLLRYGLKADGRIADPW